MIAYCCNTNILTILFYKHRQVEDGRYPYTVALMVGGRFGCGGTLIGKDTVLTAA